MPLPKTTARLLDVVYFLRWANDAVVVYQLLNLIPEGFAGANVERNMVGGRDARTLHKGAQGETYK